MSPKCISAANCEVTVSLEDVPPSAICIELYKFAFNNEAKYVLAGSSLSASFTLNKGSTYEDQSISAFDHMNQTGEQVCSFSINSEQFSLHIYIVIFL